jgi:hypothetical protein
MQAAESAAAVGSVPAAEDVLRGRLRSPARTLFEALRGYPGNRGEADGAVSTAACLVSGCYATYPEDEGAAVASPLLRQAQVPQHAEDVKS